MQSISSAANVCLAQMTRLTRLTQLTQLIRLTRFTIEEYLIQSESTHMLLYWNKTIELILRKGAC